MEIVVEPEVSEGMRVALARALGSTGHPFFEQDDANASPWLRQAIRESAGHAAEDERGYAPSPRRTRGATRA